MNYAIMPVLLLLFIIIYTQRQTQTTAVRRIISKRKRGKTAMTEIVKAYVGKACLIYTMSSSQIAGTIREVEDGWMTVDDGKDIQAVNLDYVVRVRPQPKTKSGKKKSVVLD